MIAKSMSVSFLRVACLMALGSCLALGAAAAEPAGDQPSPVQPGSIRPARLFHATSSITGRVSRVRVDVGDAVKAGEVLAELDPTRAQLECELALTKLNVARARYEELKAIRPAREQLQVAELEIKGAEVLVQLARCALDETRICAVRDGTVLVRRVEVGDVVSPQGSKDCPAILFSLADLRQLEAVVTIPVNLRNQVFLGQPCRIQGDALPKTALAGKVVRISPVADPHTRAFLTSIAIQLPPEGNPALVGSYVSVTFLRKN